MKGNTISAIIVALLVAALVGGVWYVNKHPLPVGQGISFGNVFGGAGGAASSTDASGAPVAQVAVGNLTQSYSNSTYHFSVSYPEGYTAHAVDDATASGTTVLIQDAAGKGIQIFISPWTDSDTTITPERIQQDIPDMTVENPQPVNMTAPSTGSGQAVGQGLAFESNNDAFGGASREVWFVYPECSRGVCHGNLYQISTYLEYDDVLKAMLGTWKFQ